MNDELSREIDRILSDSKVQSNLQLVTKPAPTDARPTPDDSKSNYALLMIVLAFFVLLLSFIMPTRADQAMFAGFAIVLLGMGVYRIEHPREP